MEPPKWIIRLIKFYCPPQLAESIIGDIWEQYLTDKERFSHLRSNQRLIWNALRFFRPGILLRNSKTQIINKAMLRINLLLALRNMRKYKFYSAINILGLSLSISFGLLVFFYVQNAINHDAFHDEHESIFRITKETRNRVTDELIEWGSSTCNQLTVDLRNEIPSIQYITRLLSGSAYVTKGAETFTDRVTLVDPDYFEMFSLPVIEGNETNPLSNISQVVISPEAAEKYFGISSPIGKELEITVGNDPYTFIVSAVIDPVKELNSIPFQLAIHIDNVENLIPDKSFLSTYNVTFLETFVKFSPEEDIKSLEELLSETYERVAGIEPDEDRVNLKLQPISKLYWWSNEFPGEGEAVSYNPEYVYILIGLCLLVLVIAVLNFIMLTSSQSLNRIKEFGIRKTMGAFKRQLSSQLLLEVALQAVVATMIALITTYYFTPIFNALANAELRFNISTELLLFIVALIGIISIVSTTISSGMILRLKTTTALKGTTTLGGSSVARSIMVITQFTFCIGLITGTIVFRSQMNYVSNKSLGFEKAQLVEVELPSNTDEAAAKDVFRLFKNELMKQSQVKSVAATMTTLSYPWTKLSFRQEDDSELELNFNLVTPEYLETMHIELISGRDFREDDTGKSIIVNEALVKKMEWENPLGKQIPGKEFKSSHEVIGVVKDFHFNSLHEEVTPLVMAVDISKIREGVTGISSYVWPPQLFTVMVKVGPGDINSSAKAIENSWKQTLGDIPFELNYVNDILNDKYKEENRYSSIINYAAGFSLFIAWLGLLALTRMVIHKRFKEMGIRKVLGSSSINIIMLVAKKFIMLIGMATLIASPIAWWLLSDWLSDFAYKIDLNILVFAFAGVIVILVTFISISIQSLKLSRMNPSEALRME